MIASFFITLLGGIVGLLYAENKKMNKEVAELKYSLHLNKLVDKYKERIKSLDYQINDAIKEADENERWG